MVCSTIIRHAQTAGSDLASSTRQGAIQTYPAPQILTKELAPT
jgi:hypothetical protein